MIQIIPTDTCYGLAWEMNEQDYREIYRLKWRDFSKKLAILVYNFDSLREIAEISDKQIQKLQEYQYPWSAILPINKNYILPHFLDIAGYSNISFRVAEYCIPPSVRDMISYPLFLTSANLSGKYESTNLIDAKEYFPWIDGYDGWICDYAPSDIFSFTADNEKIYFRQTPQKKSL